jgi:hypothetical protein
MENIEHFLGQLTCTQAKRGKFSWMQMEQISPLDFTERTPMTLPEVISMTCTTALMNIFVLVLNTSTQWISPFGLNLPQTYTKKCTTCESMKLGKCTVE